MPRGEDLLEHESLLFRLATSICEHRGYDYETRAAQQ
jgi:hypothetical protein